MIHWILDIKRNYNLKELVDIQRRKERIKFRNISQNLKIIEKLIQLKRFLLEEVLLLEINQELKENLLNRKSFKNIKRKINQIHNSLKILIIVKNIIKIILLIICLKKTKAIYHNLKIYLLKKALNPLL